MSIAFLLSWLWAVPPPPSQSPDENELVRLETIWNEAHERGDAEALDRLWADDFVAIVPGMPAMTKAETMGIWRSGHVKFDSYRTSGVEVRLYGDAALVHGRLRRERSMNGRTQDDDWLFSKVYVKQSGAWRVVAFHASPSPP